MSSSVKFQQTVDDVRKHGLAHEVGAAVTRGSGPSGYLAVCFTSLWSTCHDYHINIAHSSILLLMETMTGLPQTAPIESSPHQDAHIRLALGTSRTARVVDSTRSQ